jgi:uncharacterized protein YkwD
MTGATGTLRVLCNTVVVGTAFAVAAVGLLVAGGAAATGAGTATSARLAMSSDTYEQRVQSHVNRVRAAHDLGRLRFEGCTDRTAEGWASRLAATGTLVHQDIGTVLRRCDAAYAGETLGRGGFSPRGLVRAWMRSPDHRRVLLSAKARRIGVGSHLSGGQWVTAAEFTRF